ncbi:hypothetical protein [Micromonospora sp. MH99]|uniref:hypothetical protein n=1 Tax=Micromonospora sp. MH99 TaxID=1945510 RepID=UPI001F1A0381|nr:hypothetical protein [Micromonospora sp. MH99]MCF0094390.1 hypothetical protein [Micromonospora sp. MH99]
MTGPAPSPHTSAAMALDVYANLFDDDVGKVDRLERAPPPTNTTRATQPVIVGTLRRLSRPS